jgi:hypothetical protein
MFAKIINDQVLEYPYDPKKDYPHTNFPIGNSYPQFNIYWVHLNAPVNPDPINLIAKEIAPFKSGSNWYQGWEFVKLSTATTNTPAPICMSFTIADTLETFKKEARVEFGLQKTNIEALESKIDNLLSSANVKLNELEVKMADLVSGYEQNQLAIQSYIPILDSLMSKVEFLEEAITSSTSLTQLTEQITQAIKQSQVITPVTVAPTVPSSILNFRDISLSNLTINRTSTLQVSKNTGIVITSLRDTWEHAAVITNANQVLNSTFEIVFRPSSNAVGLIGLAPLSTPPQSWVYGSSFQKFFDICEYFAESNGLKVGYTYGNYKWGQNHDDLTVTQGVKLSYSAGSKVGSKCRLVNVNLNASDLHSPSSEVGTAVEWTIQSAPAKVILPDSTLLGLAVSLKTGSVEIYSTNFIPNK